MNVRLSCKYNLEMKKSWQMHHGLFCEKRNIELSKMLTAVILFFLR